MLIAIDLSLWARTNVLLICEMDILSLSAFGLTFVLLCASRAPHSFISCKFHFLFSCYSMFLMQGIQSN